MPHTRIKQKKYKIVNRLKLFCLKILNVGTYKGLSKNHPTLNQIIQVHLMSSDFLPAMYIDKLKYLHVQAHYKKY